MQTFTAGQAVSEADEPSESLTNEEEEGSLSMDVPMLVAAGVGLFVGGTVIAGAIVQVISNSRAKSYGRQVKRPGSTSHDVDAYASMVAMTSSSGGAPERV